MKKSLFFLMIYMSAHVTLYGQSPSPFSCTGSDGFGYYTSSASSNQNGNILTFESSRISKITTATGNRVTLCASTTIGVSLNGMAFNPHDNYLYAVSRYDAAKFSGVLYRIGENCQKMEIPVTGPIVKFNNNNTNTIDNAGGNISSATFDLDNHYYVNTSYRSTSVSGFTNKLQKILLNNNNTATVLSTVNLTCPSCTGTNKLRITDIIFDEASNKLYGKNEETDKLYSINSTTGVITEVGATGITTDILGMYKNRDGNIRAIGANGNIYSVNIVTGVYTFLSTINSINSSNADAGSGCYAPPKISGKLYIDANGLSDNIVNGIGTQVAGNTIMSANLVQNGLVVKTAAIDTDGSYQFLGLFTGSYEVQISANVGTIGQAAPSQNLPNTYQWVGDNIGSGIGNDGTPNGKQSITIAMGEDKVEVNFGIDGKPVTSGQNVPTQDNPNGSAQVTVPALSFSDPEEPNISNITIQTIPNPNTLGTLYYNGIAVTPGQLIPNYIPSLLKIDPVDGNVVIAFTFFTTDLAGVNSNISFVTMTFSGEIFPVEWVSFTGRYQDGVNILDWSTASEVNSDYFVVEKRQKDGEFIEIGTQSAVGTSSSMSRYQFTDREVDQMNYYRLLQIDLDGKFEYSPTISVRGEKQIILSAYPTIAQDYIQVECEIQHAQEQKYVILNMFGRVVQSGVLMNDISVLTISDLASGHYIIQVGGQDNLPETVRFVKP